MKNFLKTLLCKYLNCYYIDEYEKEKNEKNKIFWISNRDDNKVLCNTLLLAIYKDKFCNIKMKEELSKYGIIISIGSACNTSSNKSSDVIQSLNIPKELRSGILRISLLDDVLKKDIINFVTHFLGLIDITKY